MHLNLPPRRREHSGPFVVLWLILATIHLPTPTALEGATLSRISQWPDTPRLEPKAMHLDGSRLWIGRSDGLTVLDVSDPAGPAVWGSVELSQGSVGDIFVAGPHAYTLHGTNVIQVIDLTASEAMKVLATITADRWVDKIYVLDDWLYTAHNAMGLGRTRLTDLGNVQFGGRLQSIRASGRPQAVGDTVYVPTLGGLEVHRLTSPGQFDRLGTRETGGIVEAVQVVGNLAYLAAHDGLRILNVQDPAAILPVGAYATAQRGLDVRVVGQLACLACDERTFRVLDVNDPTQPALLGVYEAPGFLTGVEATTTHAFIRDRALEPGLTILSLEDPALPQFVGRISASGSTEQVSLAGNLACVADKAGGLLTLDLQDPAHPVAVGSYNTGGDVTTVAAGDGLACVGGFMGLTVVDLADPAHPTPRGLLMLMQSPSQIRMLGDRAFVMTGPGMGDLIVVGLANPDAPVQLGSHLVMDAYDLAVTDTGYAALALGPQGVEIVDARDPAAMGRVVLHSAVAAVYGVDLQPRSGGFRAYLATTDGLEIVDFAPPESPAPVGSWVLDEANAHCVCVSGQRAYLASASHLWALDVSDPAAPELLATATGSFKELVPVGDRLGSASGTEGLVLWELQTGVVAPFLHHTRMGGGLRLGWTEAGLGWVLEQSTDLTDPNGWEALAGSEQQTERDVPASAEAAFFRLSGPK